MRGVEKRGKRKVTRKGSGISLSLESATEEEKKKKSPADVRRRFEEVRS